MQIVFLSLFPEIIESYIRSSIASRTAAKGLVSYINANIRDFASGKHKECDDAPYGGGAGMVLKPEPLHAAIAALKPAGAKVIYATPSGKPFTQAKAKALAKEEALLFIAGRYEGIDQRIIDMHVDEELSMGDFIMSSGELACMAIGDAVMRLLDGAINAESLREESFEGGLLEYPLYTRPEVFEGQKIPEILLSGHHAQIQQWRLEKRIEKTIANRPEFMQNKQLSANAQKIAEQLKNASANHAADHEEN